MAPKEKPKEMHRNHIVCLRLTDAELAFLNESADRSRLSRSEYLRKLILGKKVLMKYEVVADSNEIKKLAGEYGKIGSNLNQIAKHFNSGGDHDELDKVNEDIRAAGLKLASNTFQTQKQFLRDAIDECSQISDNFDQFQSLLLDKFNISVIEQRGTYRYLHPDRDKRISAKSLGANYGKEYLEHKFQHHEAEKEVPQENKSQAKSISSPDYHTNPFIIFYVKSELRLVTDLQKNVKAMQNQAYARKVKISNLQQMANTLIYIQDHGYDTREQLELQTSDIQSKLGNDQNHLSELTSKMKTLNAQIHYTGQYYASKSVYAEFLKSQNKKKFRQEHSSEIKSYEESRDWLKAFYPDGKKLSMKFLKSQKVDLQESINTQKAVVKQFRDHYKELEIVGSNVNAILSMEKPPVQSIYEKPTETEKMQSHTQHKRLQRIPESDSL